MYVRYKISFYNNIIYEIKNNEYNILPRDFTTLFNLSATF